MQKRFFLSVVTFLVGMFLTSLYAQTHIVTGSVTDKEMGEPLIGVNVLVKGTTTGTVTDMSGNYSIQASSDDVLVFSYVSMKTVEEQVGNRKVINVVMASDAESLGEVVVSPWTKTKSGLTVSKTFLVSSKISLVKFQRF